MNIIASNLFRFLFLEIIYLLFKQILNAYNGDWGFGSFSYLKSPTNLVFKKNIYTKIKINKFNKLIFII